MDLSTMTDDTEPSAEALALLRDVMGACLIPCAAPPCECATRIDRFRAAGVREERERLLTPLVEIVPQSQPGLEFTDEAKARFFNYVRDWLYKRALPGASP
jgi:hypothetical protein